MPSFFARALRGAFWFLVCTATATGASAHEPLDVLTVVKVMPLPWFSRMAQGVMVHDAELGGGRAHLQGPARAEPALQAALIQKLLNTEPLPKALVIVPTDPPALEDLARQALEKGVVVVTHEADNLVNTQADLEPFEAPAFGAALNQRLVDCMGGRGQWTSFVGTRASRTHLRWIEGAVANAAAHPQMELIEPLNESNDDAEQAYRRARELLQRHPQLRGFQGTASSDVIGIARAVKEHRPARPVCVVGTGLPARSREGLESGLIQAIGFWDPRDAGLALNRLAQRLLKGESPSEGMDLGVPGYRKLHLRPGPGRGVVLTGEAAVIVGREAARAYSF